MSHTFLATIALGLAGCTMLAGAAAASPPSRAVTVSYAEVDLGTDAGVENLYRNLRRAARSACNPSDRRDALSEASFEVCAAEALERAIAQVGNARLTARLNGRKVPAPTASVAAR